MSTIINEALWIENGEGAARAHRVCITGSAGRDALITFLDTPGRGTGRVPRSELASAAPLSPAEEREYDRLDAELAGTIGDRRKLRRFNALRLRSLASEAQP